jgi:hypothetical protein
MGMGDLYAGGDAGIGNNLFAAISADLTILLLNDGLAFVVTRHSMTPPSRDIYGTPQDTPTTFNASLLLVDQEMKEKPTELGGKRYEVLTFLGQPGTLLESDIVAYNGHTYDVFAVASSVLNATVQCDSYQAQREVDV